MRRLRRWWRRWRGDRTLEWCQSCGRTVAVVWVAVPDVLWNEVCGHDDVLCVSCFDARCEQRGVVLTWEARVLVRVG